MAGEADAIAISGGDGGWGGGWGGGFWPLWLMNQQICDGNRDIMAGMAAQNTDVIKAISDSDGRLNLHLSNMQANLASQICDVKTQTLLAAKDNALEMCHLKSDLSTQIASLSHQLSDCCCKIERQISDCCCELEKNIATSALQTQQLIQAQEAQKLRDQLAAEQQKNLIFQLQGGNCNCRK